MSVVVCADRESGWVARCGAASECGRREANQDSFHIDRKYPFALVLDGVGAPGAGEMASRVGAEVVRDALRRGLKRGDEPRSVIERALRHGHEHIAELGKREPEFRNCGTTVVLALLHRGTAYISWLGDSPAFLVTDDRIERLTWDHDWGTVLVRQRRLTEEEARHLRWRDPLAYYLGGKWPKGEDRLEILTHTPTPGDRILLVSDGVSKPLNTEEILAVCRDHPGPQSCAERLVAAALKHGGYDNATCVVMGFEWVGDGPPSAPEAPASHQPEHPPRRWWRFWR